MMKTGRTLLRGSAVAGLMGLAAILMTSPACDTTAKFELREVRFDEVDPVRLVGVTPVDADRNPACLPGSTVAGFRSDFILLSTPQVGDDEGNNDLLIRDGDRVSGSRVSLSSNTISTQNFQFSTVAGENNSLDSVSAGSGNGQVFQNAPAALQELRFEQRNNSRSAPAAVAVIVDNSGSMRGRVDPDSFFEISSTTATALQVSGASADPNRERFDVLAQELLWRLNPDDSAIAWFLNDDGVHLACKAPEVEPGGALAGQPLSVREEFCARPENKRWIAAPQDQRPGGELDAFSQLLAGAGTIGGIDVISGGRTPLWAAVNHAWDFLNGLNLEEGAARHIVVLTDSPDTCTTTANGGSYWVESIGCSFGEVAPATYTDFQTKVLNTADAIRIPISIVQLQSTGYTQPDPAQVQASCLTGGTYHFINGNDIAKNTGQDFANFLVERISRIRYTIGGVWQLFADAQGSLGQYGPEVAYAVLEGQFEFNPLNLPLSNNDVEPFRNQAQQGDRRLRLAYTCQNEAACGGSDDDCVNSCIGEGSMCSLVDSVESFVSSQTCCCGATGDYSVAGSCFWDVEPCCSTGGEHLLCQ